MKHSFYAVAVLLLTNVIAVAKDKKKPEPPAPPPVYDHVGTLRYLNPKWDASSHVTFSDGSTASMYCNYYGSTADCSARYSDSGGWFADLEDGVSDALALVHTREYMERCSSWVGPSQELNCGDPLSRLRQAGLTFPYRQATTFPDGVKNQAFCVPYTYALWRGRSYTALGTSATFPIPPKYLHLNHAEACYYSHTPLPARSNAATPPAVQKPEPLVDCGPDTTELCAPPAVQHHPADCSAELAFSTEGPAFGCELPGK